MSEAVDILPETSTRTVYIERELDSPQIDSIMVDNVTAARLAAEHLINLGHRKIVIVTGLMKTITGRQRFQGFADAPSAHHFSLPDEYILNGNIKLDSGVYMAR